MTILAFSGGAPQINLSPIDRVITASGGLGPFGPTIGTQPSNAYVLPGATATFTVVASNSGGGTLSYQWKKNGTNVSGGSGGTSASYTTAALALSDDTASYTCVVTETGGVSPGTATSTAATLRVGILLVASSTAVYTATGTPTTIAPTWPTTAILSGAVGKVVLVIGMKPATSGAGSVTTPSGWTLVGNIQAAGGYTAGGASAADTGNCDLYVYAIDDPGTVSGTLSVTLNVGSTTGVAWARMQRYSAPPGTTFSLAMATGSDTSAGNVSITFGSDPGVASGDRVLAAMCIPTDVTTPAQFSAQAFSQTGVTFGTVAELEEPDSANNNDIGGLLLDVLATSGTSSAAPVMTATAGGTTTNVRGPGIFLRLRAATLGAGIILSANTPSEARLPAQGALYAGSGQAAQAPRQFRSNPVELPAPGSGTIFAGFGQAAQAPRQFRSSPIDLSPPARQPAIYAGVVPVAVVAAAQVISSPLRPTLPTVEKPFTVKGGGQAAQPPAIVRPSLGLPSEAGMGGGSLTTGIAPDDVAVLLSSSPLAGASLPPLPVAFLGFGKAAQVAVVLQDPWFSSATFDPVPLPPRPVLSAGFGQAAQVATVVRAADTRAPVVAPSPASYAGFGAAAQSPTVLYPTVLQLALPPPLPVIRPGFGAAAQPPVVLWELVAPSADLPPLVRSLAGVVPPATTAGSVLASSTVSPYELPPRARVVVGFGQPAQVATIATAPLVPPQADLPPDPTSYAGFGQAAQVAVVIQASDSRPPVAFALPSVFAGFGQAATAPAILSAPSSPPRAERFLLPALLAGAGLPPPLPVPPVYSPTPFAPRFELPPTPSLRAGAGQAAQAAVVLFAATSPPRAELLVAGRLVAGFGQATSLPPPIVFSAPQSAPAALLPPLQVVIGGAGQAAQVAVVYVAARAPEPAALPPTSFIAAGVAPAGVAYLTRAPATPTIEAPRPQLTKGFGQAAQVATVSSPVTLAPFALIPPQPLLFAGFAPPPAAAIFRSPDVTSAPLPPSPALLSGYGFPSQVAVVLTIPYGTAEITRLPPNARVFAGFGSINLFTKAGRGRISFSRARARTSFSRSRKRTG